MKKTRQEMISQIVDRMGNHEFDTSPASAEYQLIDYLCSDDEVKVMSEMKLMMPLGMNNRTTTMKPL